MYLLDTDHISVLERGGASAQPLLAKIARINPNEVATTIITYEEQMRGWLTYIAKADSIERQIAAYRKLENQLVNYRAIVVVSFDERAGQIFQNLRTSYPRLGSMDLKIAAIAFANQATLLTRNLKDFGQIENLQVEDWTV
ncbi:putative nucleic acid-binding protein, contains PIN domain [Nostoc sp. PCC 7524]|uniref:type II toxin-antitoxin system VapC family toxin n=1 Tax=Nostoc sp. (strain ATCC 29411 / PCC 7524) TaxID=28072 RepID=UPI00029EDA3C|nr:type II toxin-antitoxin system VapC family toxin [Nostoc sp. PCC 7524]AFY47072.1 putative nucleic acid-binding protein, contains PIN domain [Nostoc sp. PCC 7524]